MDLCRGRDFVFRVFLCGSLAIFASCATPKGDSEIESSSADNSSSSGEITDDDLQLDQANEKLDAELSKEESPADLPADQNASQGSQNGESASIPPVEEPQVPVEVVKASEVPKEDVIIEVKDIRYNSEANAGTMEIYFSGAPTYRLREEPDRNQVILEVANSDLPVRLRRPFNTKDFHQAIQMMNAYQEKGSTTSRFVFQLKEPGSLRAIQDGNSILISSTDSTPVQPIAAENVNSDKKDDVTALGTSSLDQSMSVVKFTGRPISLEVRDTPVREILQLIAEQVGANIIVSEDVKGNLTLKLRQVPWDQALLLVLKSQKLGYVRQGNVLRIAPLMTLQAETNEAKAVADAQQNAEPLRVKVIPVSYAKPESLKTQIGNFLSSRGKVVDDVRTNSVIVTDTAENIDRISNLIKALDTPPLQVLIEGKIVEASENFRLDYGLRWNYSGAQTTIGDQYLLNQTMNVASPTSQTAGNTLNLRIGTFEIFGDIDATLGLAETNNQAKVLSSPRVVALNNEQATINQSTSIQIPSITTINGQSTTTTTERKLMLNLDVTPQITSESDVIMKVSLKREFPANASKVPDINSREANTKVIVKNGQTAVIGGVYQNDNSESELGIPLLKDIPLLGWLFKEKNIIRSRNELLLFLTPRILNADKGIIKEENL